MRREFNAAKILDYNFGTLTSKRSAGHEKIIHENCISNHENRIMIVQNHLNFLSLNLLKGDVVLRTLTE